MRSDAHDRGRLSRRTFLGASAAGLAALATPRARAAAGPASVEEIAETIPKLLEEFSVPGLQISLIRDGQRVWFASFGVKHLETGEPVTNDTVFQAASLTKPVFAYHALKLVESGKLDLDAPLVDIVEPQFNGGPPDRLRGITARRVLTHTTGLPNWFRGDRELHIKPSQGRLWSYSGMGFVFLQRAVETIDGQGIDRTLREGLFAKLGMPSADLSWREAYARRMVYGHTTTGKTQFRTVTEVNAASSLICTAEDYMRYVEALLNPPAADDVFLQSGTLAAMLQAQIEADDHIAWGLGWGLQHAPGEPYSFWHWGNNNGVHKSYVTASRERGEGVLVMTNSTHGLQLCKKLVPLCVSAAQPALDWRTVN